MQPTLEEELNINLRLHIGHLQQLFSPNRDYKIDTALEKKNKLNWENEMG